MKQGTVVQSMKSQALLSPGGFCLIAARRRRSVWNSVDDDDPCQNFGEPRRRTDDTTVVCRHREETPSSADRLLTKCQSALVA